MREEIFKIMKNKRKTRNDHRFFFTGNNNVLTLHNMIKAVILLNYWDKKINAKQKK